MSLEGAHRVQKCLYEINEEINAGQLQGSPLLSGSNFNFKVLSPNAEGGAEGAASEQLEEFLNATELYLSNVLLPKVRGQIEIETQERKYHQAVAGIRRTSKRVTGNISLLADRLRDLIEILSLDAATPSAREALEIAGRAVCVVTEVEAAAEQLRDIIDDCGFPVRRSTSMEPPEPLVSRTSDVGFESPEPGAVTDRAEALEFVQRRFSRAPSEGTWLEFGRAEFDDWTTTRSPTTVAAANTPEVPLHKQGFLDGWRKAYPKINLHKERLSVAMVHLEREAVAAQTAENRVKTLCRKMDAKNAEISQLKGRLRLQHLELAKLKNV